jgi:hypothetical protein
MVETAIDHRMMMQAGVEHNFCAYTWSDHGYTKIYSFLKNLIAKSIARI